MADPIAIEPYLAAVEQRLERARGGDHSGGMDPWQMSVENRLASIDSRLGRLDEKMDRQFLVTWGGIIASALGLAALIAKGFGWL